MKISLQNLGKRFNREWLFRHFNYEFQSNKAYAITGPNGSGKSTFLQIIAGYSIFNEGKIIYEVNGKSINADNCFKHVSIAAPYLELIEEMTLKEFLVFHGKMKPLISSYSIEDIAAIIGLSKALDKEIRYFSSGMKQRVKLAQAIFSDVHAVLLDEPTTNLDAEGISLYKTLINDHSEGRIVMISSNDQEEYDFCDEIIDIKHLTSVTSN